MVRIAPLFALVLLASGCMGIIRVDTAHLPEGEAAVLFVPVNHRIGKVDGREVRGPWCTGYACGSGTEIFLTPGAHSVEVKYVDHMVRAVEFSTIRQYFQAGTRYRVLNDFRGGRVLYQVVEEPFQRSR